ncbi:terminase family protein [Chromobacterium phragmitis]|uniref:terminase large subunit n=1 Tax=Chromobacterium amazonense TaxID=1382803 RepID=UPI0021B70E13|nr:terminase large subunit [Chromobacterium amazonense]MBM2883922.1 terminase family protein [Chromobacterium amazonense]MDE1711839.1 terminase large subunit [Chromobacterium amazonense]
MPSLNVPQSQFLAMDHKFRAYVAGFGSGKTWVGCGGLMQHFWQFPLINAGYFAPTYAQIRDIFYPTVEEVAFDWGLKVKINESNKEVHVYEGRKYRGTVICRSMEKPETIVGFKIGKALCDELDVMKAEKARAAWRKIIARMRYKVDNLKNGVDVTTTPEGFKFVYEQFVAQVAEKPELATLYGLIQASTYDNEANLPDDYIDSLFLTYPPQLIEAYLNGQFCNLTSGSVYPCFDRKLNHSDAEIQPYEQLHIGMDFNVLKMAAVLYVIRDGNPIAVDELVDVRDTPEMARMIVERWRSKNHAVTIYPDASGQNTSSKSASESDLTILRSAGFTVSVGASNPAVKDRVLSVNAMLLNGRGERRMRVNTRRCPRFTKGLEQQAYDTNGEPDKKSGVDHVNDAGGYPIVRLWPIAKKVAVVSKPTGY